jgi:hypothetical protein
LPKDILKQSFASIITHERQRLFVINIEPFANHVLVIIIPLKELPATTITDILLLWRVKRPMIVFPALSALTTP